MNKFGSPDEEEYLTVADEIEGMVKEAPRLLAARFKYFPKNRRGSYGKQVDNEFKAVKKEVKKYFHVAWTDWQKISEVSPEPGGFQWAINMPQARSWIEDKGYRLLYVEYNDSWDCIAGISLAFYQQLRQNEALEVIYGLAPADAEEIRSGTWKTSLPRMLLAQILTHYPQCISSMNKAIEDLDDETFEMAQAFGSGDPSWEHQWVLLSCALHSLDKNVVLMFINFKNELYQDLETGLSHLSTGHCIGSSRSDFSCKVLIVGTPKSQTPRDDEQSALFAMSPRRINEETERKLCLSSLHFPELHARRELIEKPEGSTTRWIRQHQAYTSLKSQSTSLLWIHGKPGSGKSTLAAALQRSLSKDSPDLLLADFFYSSRFGPTQRDHLWMLRSILYQLLRKHETLYSCYRDRFRKFQGSKSKSWTYKLLKEILLELRYVTTNGNKGYTFLLIVDGIDESEHGYSTEVSRQRILQLFSHLCRSEKKSKFKIIALSRSESAIKDALRPTLSIDMKEVNQADIEWIVQYHISRIWRQISHYNEVYLTASSSTLDDRDNDGTVLGEEEDIIDVPQLEFVRTYLLTHADGVILWVVMVLREIESKAKAHTICELEQILSKIPTGLDELYEDIFDRLKLNQYRDPGQATYVFTWLLFAQDVLTVCETRDAMALFYWDELSGNELRGDYLRKHRVQQSDGNWDPTWTLLTNLCGGFIEIVPRGRSVAKDTWREQAISPDDYVQLIHRTARDFILSKTEAALRDSTRCVNSLCTACVNYLELTFVDDLDRLRPFIRHLDDRPLLRYMLKNIPGILIREINERNTEATELYCRIVQYMAQAWLDRHHTVTWTFFSEFCRELFILERDNRLHVQICDDCDSPYLRQLEVINDDLSVNVDVANYRAPRNPPPFMYYLTLEAEIVRWRNSVRTNMMPTVLRHIGILFAKEHHGHHAALKILLAAIGGPSSEENAPISAVAGDVADSLSDYSGSLIRQHHHKHSHHRHPRHRGDARHDSRHSSRSLHRREYGIHLGEDSDDERLYSIRANYSSSNGDLHRRNKRNRLCQLAMGLLCIT
ncbi:hypothetical protein F5B19DRAFT_194414 [Rostrohypoxylon terebratum]|nr:hypothetical protein F5B19DRAFT_194414 [Rostrohypoxylon terebratum]